ILGIYTPAYAINSSIKKKTDMIPIISTAPWKHIQIDLINFHEFSDVNSGVAWLLTCVCIFSKFLVAIPTKSKEATTVATHLVKDIFKIWLPDTLQSDNDTGYIKRTMETYINTSMIYYYVLVYSR